MAPSPIDYQGTLRLTPIVDGDRTFIEWFVEFDAKPGENSQWTGLLLELISQWVESLRRTLAGNVEASAWQSFAADWTRKRREGLSGRHDAGQLAT